MPVEQLGEELHPHLEQDRDSLPDDERLEHPEHRLDEPDDRLDDQVAPGQQQRRPLDRGPDRVEDRLPQQVQQLHQQGHHDDQQHRLQMPGLLAECPDELRGAAQQLLELGSAPLSSASPTSTTIAPIQAVIVAPEAPERATCSMVDNSSARNAVTCLARSRNWACPVSVTCQRSLGHLIPDIAIQQVLGSVRGLTETRRQPTPPEISAIAHHDVRQHRRT